MAVISCFLQGFRFFGASVIYLFFCPSVKMATRSGPTATLAPQVSLSLLHISAVVRMDGLGPAYGQSYMLPLKNYPVKENFCTSHHGGM